MCSLHLIFESSGLVYLGLDKLDFLFYLRIPGSSFKFQGICGSNRVFPLISAPYKGGLNTIFFQNYLILALISKQEKQSSIKRNENVLKNNRPILNNKEKKGMEMIGKNLNEFTRSSTSSIDLLSVK